jgi:hypothetical protein
MEVKNLFDPVVKQEIIDRINKLTPQSQRQWGKMDVAQMLTHLQKPINFSFGNHQLQGNFIMKLIGPLFKSILYNEKPYKQGLPTDKTYIISDTREFEKEKQQLLDLINRFSESAIQDLPHPVFGKLTKEQWSKATWKHLDHHLKQFGA